jgi:hypothetical protein
MRDGLRAQSKHLALESRANAGPLRGIAHHVPADAERGRRESARQRSCRVARGADIRVLARVDALDCSPPESVHGCDVPVTDIEESFR